MDTELIFSAFLYAHVSSRFVASTFLYTHSYARIDQEIGKSKPIAKHQLGISDWLVLIVFVVICIFLLPDPVIGLAIVPAFVFKFFFGRFMQKWIGGYTGDCLGATQQVAEVIIYLSMIAIWRFI